MSERPLPNTISSGPLHSAIYEGKVRHRRYLPKQHAFSMPLYMMFIDLCELDQVFKGRMFWSTKWPNVSWLRRSDYFGDPSQTIDSQVRQYVSKRLGFAPTGPVRMLVHLRTWGYCFNPVSFYYCYDESGHSVEAIVADITNTPWNERHAYALDVRGKDANKLVHSFEKAFHVSPFMPMDQEYKWKLGVPSQTLFVHMKNHDQGGSQARHMFDATLVLRRTEISTRSLARVLTIYPFVTLAVVLGIYWHALQLWLKRVPFHTHPSKRAKAAA
ncbi:MAG: DUF1365 domain-containing protein [Phycisphaerales bacterium]